MDLGRVLKTESTGMASVEIAKRKIKKKIKQASCMEL